MASCQKVLSYHTDTGTGAGWTYPYTRLQRMRVTSALLRHRQKNMTITYYNHPSTVRVTSDGLLSAKKKKTEKLSFRAHVFDYKSGRWCLGIPFSL